VVRPGISEKVAMEMTGHRTRSGFDRYRIVSTRDLAEAAEKLDGAGNLRFGYTLYAFTRPEA